VKVDQKREKSEGNMNVSKGSMSENEKDIKKEEKE